MTVIDSFYRFAIVADRPKTRTIHSYYTNKLGANNTGTVDTNNIQ